MTVEQADDRVRIMVRGALDLASADELRQAGGHALDDPACRHLVLDLSAVDFIDSTGIGVLVALRNTAMERRIPLSLQNPSERVVEVLRLTALDVVFTAE